LPGLWGKTLHSLRNVLHKSKTYAVWDHQEEQSICSSREYTCKGLPANSNPVKVGRDFDVGKRKSRRGGGGGESNLGLANKKGGQRMGKKNHGGQGRGGGTLCENRGNVVGNWGKKRGNQKKIKGGAAGHAGEGRTLPKTAGI